MIHPHLSLLQPSPMPELEGAVAALVGGLSLLGLFLGLILFALAVVWLTVPFSVFGLKRRLDTLVEWQQTMVEWQQATHEELRRLNETLAGKEEAPPG